MLGIKFMQFPMIIPKDPQLATRKTKILACLGQAQEIAHYFKLVLYS